MIKYLIKTLTLGVKNLYTNPRVIFILILVLFFPVYLLYSTQYFLSIGSDNLDTVQKARVGVIHDAFHVAIKSTENIDTIQTLLNKVSAENVDIVRFRVAELHDNEFTIVAALDTNLIGTKVVETDLFRSSYINPGVPFIYEITRNGIEHWQIVTTVTDNKGVNVFVFTEHSFEYFQNVFYNRYITAYLLLGITYIFLFGLAFILIRDIDYRVKFFKTAKTLEERDRFANVIAHELRAPLTAMRGYASLIVESPEATEVSKKHALHIADSSERMINLVSDFLEVARLQSGTFQVDIESVDISNLITSIVTELSPLAKEKKLELRNTIPPKINIFSDPSRLKQVFTNILSNAIKYTKEGHIELVLKDHNTSIEVRVKDTGSGISATDQQKMFTPFFRVQKTGQEKIVGTGLGMWITKSLIEKLGGAIGIESIVDVGTNVVISLPKNAK